jgi:hypothetical protein
MAAVDDIAKLPDASDVRRIRELERQLAQAKSNLTGLKTRYDLTENDLALADKKIELLTATEGVFNQKDLERSNHKRGGEATAIIVATDWHSEETVDPRTVNGENKFNLSIADKRIQQLWDKAILLTESERQLSRIDHCLLAGLGDFMGGHIHEELAESNSLTPCETILWIQDRLFDGIRYLKKFGGFKTIDVRFCSGNHGRDTKKQRISTREKHSYEWVAYQSIAKFLALTEPSVKVTIADGILMYVDVMGHLLRLTHGDTIKYGGGVGGLTIPAAKRIHRWNETRPAYLTLFGHFHQMLIGNGFIACPTLKGYDPFSVSIGAPKEPPSQLFAVLDRKRGLTVAKRIFVE